MAQPVTEDPTLVDEIFPDDDPESDIALTDALDGEDDLEVTVEPPPAPLGHSAAFDFTSGRFLTSGHAPRTVRGLDTLRGWVEKCLRTHEGAHPVHPEGYGLAEPISSYLDDGADIGVAELEEAITEALLFHPAIKRIENMDTELGDTPDGDLAVNISFTVITDDDSDFNFATIMEV